MLSNCYVSAFEALQIGSRSEERTTNSCIGLLKGRHGSHRYQVSKVSIRRVDASVAQQLFTQAHLILCKFRIATASCGACGNFEMRLRKNETPNPAQHAVTIRTIVHVASTSHRLIKTALSTSVNVRRIISFELSFGGQLEQLYCLQPKRAQANW